MDEQTIDTREQSQRLLREGVAAARAGNDEEARVLLRRATDLDESNVDAWIWRSSIADGIPDKKAYLQQALSIDPTNEEARDAFNKILEREGELAERAEDEPLYCTVHPDRETMLRCNRCGRPMCTECAVRHPVGMRCRECVQETRSPIYDVSARNVAIALLVGTTAGVIGGVIAWFVSRIFWFLLLFVSPAIGGGIAEAIERATPRKRGRPLQITAGVSVVLGLVVMSLGLGLLSGNVLGGLVGILFSGRGLFLWLYAVLAVGAAAARLR